MKLPIDVEDWPALWRFLYRERVSLLWHENPSLEQCESDAETTLRHIAETEKAEDLGESRYAAIIDREELRTLRERWKGKATSAFRPAVG